MWVWGRRIDHAPQLRVVWSSRSSIWSVVSHFLISTTWIASTHLFDYPPPLSEIWSPTRSLPSNTPLPFTSCESPSYRIKVYRWHIEWIDNCEMWFNIDFRRVRSLCIVVCLSSVPVRFSRWGALHQVVRSRRPSLALSRRLVMMNLQSALSVFVGLTFAFEILFGPKFKSSIPLVIRYFILSSAQSWK